MRRTVCRTSSSAVEVTVQVLRTTRSASPGPPAASSPLAARPASMAAPSACEARHPKFLTQNRFTTFDITRNTPISGGGARGRYANMADRVLSQEEIDNVFKLRDGGAEDDGTNKAQAYDFRRPDRIAKDQLRA